MRRILTIAIATILLCTAQEAWSIDVKSTGSTAEKKDSTAQPPTPTPTGAGGAQPAIREAERTKGEEAAPAPEEKKSGGNLLDKLRRQVLQSKKESKPSYDQFRDKNNDGVADKVAAKRDSESGEAAAPAGESVQPSAAPVQAEPKTKSDADTGAKSNATPKSAGRKKPK